MHEVEDLWSTTLPMIACIFESLGFPEPDRQIEVCVFPPEYRLGAAETVRGLILFGQPPRSPSFASAVIAHELSHILITRLAGLREWAVDETICLLVEDLVYRRRDSTTASRIWRVEELDAPHALALRAEEKLYHELTESPGLVLADLPDLVRSFLSDEERALHPPRGLLRNLT